MTKSQIPNPNDQSSMKTTSADRRVWKISDWGLVIGPWDLIGIWDLDIGISLDTLMQPAWLASLALPDPSRCPYIQ
jgi:hypothetical protein